MSQTIIAVRWIEWINEKRPQILRLRLRMTVRWGSGTCGEPGLLANCRQSGSNDLFAVITGPQKRGTGSTPIGVGTSHQGRGHPPTRIYRWAPATPDQLLKSKRHVRPSGIWLKSILFFSFFGHIGSLSVKISFRSRGSSTT